MQSYCINYDNPQTRKVLFRRYHNVKSPVNKYTNNLVLINDIGYFDKIKMKTLYFIRTQHFILTISKY